jgi:protein involved in polysaccharide export with SLBB domain
MRFQISGAPVSRALITSLFTLWAASLAPAQNVYPPASGSPAAESTPSVPGPPSTGPSDSSDSTSSPFAVTNSMAALDDTRELGIGDVLAFRVVEDRAGLRSLIVTDSGEIEVPYIGRIYAKGKTCKSLAGQIKTELEKEYYQKATVIIGLDWAGTRMQRDNESFVGDKVHVWGEVRKEGAVRIPPDGSLTVTEALLAAGGFTPFADRKEVTILRSNDGDSPGFPTMQTEEKKGFFGRLFGGGSKKASKLPPNTQEIHIDVKKIMERGHLSNNIELQPDDVIIVDEKMINF